MNSKNIIFRLINVVVPILLGGILYYIFCPDVSFVNAIDEAMGAGFHIRAQNTNNELYQFIRFYAFDFAWAYAMSNALSIFLDNDLRPNPFSMVITIVIGIILELMQLWGVTIGTYDFRDVFSESLGAMVGTFIIHIRRNRR